MGPSRSHPIWRFLLRAFLKASKRLERVRDKLMISAYGGLHPKNVFSFRSEFFVGHVSPRDRVVDIACGSGAILDRVSGRVGAGLGLDCSEANLALCRKHHSRPNLGYRRADILGVDYEALRREFPYTHAIFSHILEHVEDVPALLRKVAAPQVLICVPSQENWRTRMVIDLGLDPRTDPTHFREYTRAMLEAELAQAGYAVQEMGFNPEGEIACSAKKKS